MKHVILANPAFARFMNAETIKITALCFVCAIAVCAIALWLIKCSNSIIVIDEEEEEE